MRAFTFTTVPDIHCALGAIERLPELVQRFNAQRVLIVTDQPGLFMSMLIEHREAPGCWHRLPAAVFAV